jgi:hypothetical protein
MLGAFGPLPPRCSFGSDLGLMRTKPGWQRFIHPIGGQRIFPGPFLIQELVCLDLREEQMEIPEPLLGQVQGLPELLRLGDMGRQQGAPERRGIWRIPLQLGQQSAQLPDDMEINGSQRLASAEGFGGHRRSPAGFFRLFGQGQG